MNKQEREEGEGRDGKGQARSGLYKWELHLFLSFLIIEVEKCRTPSLSDLVIRMAFHSTFL